MKLLIFSDSHGMVEPMADIAQKEQPDAIIHLGDTTRDAENLDRMLGNITICILPGNNDFFATYKKEKAVCFDGLRLFLCHGHTLQVKQSLIPLRERAKQQACAAALFGHTHQPLSEIRDGIWLFNPGSLPYSRSYGVIKTGHPPSFTLKFL